MPRPSPASQRFFESVYGLVRTIPCGRVASYGQIGRLLERPGGGRTVGWAMRALPHASDVPWHRVVNSQGRISLGGRSAALQKALLESEGVVFDETGRIDLRKFGWKMDREDL